MVGAALRDDGRVSAIPSDTSVNLLALCLLPGCMLFAFGSGPLLLSGILETDHANPMGIHLLHYFTFPLVKTLWVCGGVAFLLTRLWDHHPVAVGTARAE